MTRWWLAALLLVPLAWLAWNRVHVQPLQEKLEGRKVTVTSEGWEARYRGLGSFDGTFMIFGGEADPRRTGLHDTQLEAIDLADVGPLLERYPDLHRCTAEGARRATSLVERQQYVSANADVQRTLRQALERHEEALSSEGERVCVSLRGRHLELESLTLTEDGRDVTRELPAEVRDSEVVFAESATIVDCLPLMAEPRG